MDIQKQVQMVRARIIEVQKKLESVGLKSFSIDLEIKKIDAFTSGLASPSRNKIIINVDYLNEFQDKVLNRTVAHEVCHLYVSMYYRHAKQHHGREFRMLMMYLGQDGSARHEMHLSTEKPRRLVTRHVYLSAAGKELVHLTPKQHEKVLKGAIFTFQGQKLVYDNRVVEI